ncbi:uncharacterized protein [Euwallacea fornicatus]|uniref:uncharacterized protein n=1 Tax=Euwallacea fornicatus TaxID=995702 RepID=UPI00338E4F16
MTHFVSPTTGVFNLENLERTAQRKPTNNFLQTTRMPFVDRKVNCNPPTNTVQKKQQFNFPLKEDVSVQKAIHSRPTESLEINLEEIFSFKHFDTPFEDFLPHSQCLDQETVYTILSNWVRTSTPPPVNYLDMSFDFEEIPEQQFAQHTDSFYQENINKFQFQDCLDEVKIPSLEDV